MGARVAALETSACLSFLLAQPDGEVCVLRVFTLTLDTRPKAFAFLLACATFPLVATCYRFPSFVPLARCKVRFRLLCATLSAFAQNWSLHTLATLPLVAACCRFTGFVPLARREVPFRLLCATLPALALQSWVVAPHAQEVPPLSAPDAWKASVIPLGLRKLAFLFRCFTANADFFGQAVFTSPVVNPLELIVIEAGRPLP